MSAHGRTIYNDRSLELALSKFAANFAPGQEHIIDIVATEIPTDDSTKIDLLSQKVTFCQESPQIAETQAIIEPVSAHARTNSETVESLRDEVDNEEDWLSSGIEEEVKGQLKKKRK